ncbi:hypothetical protein [Fibrella rubiginis]|nr:hypothetical protein [Fibrella rubiginis]
MKTTLNLHDLLIGNPTVAASGFGEEAPGPVVLALEPQMET